MTREQYRAAGWGLFWSAGLAVAIFVGSRNLRHIDAALVGYTFACLFAAFGHRLPLLDVAPAAADRACTGGAAGRRSSGPATSGPTLKHLAGRFVGVFLLNLFIWRAQPAARAGPPADHVGLHPGRRHHLPAGLRLGPLRDACPAT